MVVWIILLLNYNSLANTDDGACEYLEAGCMTDLYVEYTPLIQSSDGSCEVLIIEGCTNELYVEFNPSANTDDESCQIIRIDGCTSEIADNYDFNANMDDGSCIFISVTNELSLFSDSVILLNELISSGVSTPIHLDLSVGWTMIGYTKNTALGVVDAFAKITNSPSLINEHPILLVKNVSGMF